MNEAKKLAMCIMRNRRYMNRPYGWAAHINLNVVLPPGTVTAIWTKTCRTLRRRGIVALWVSANRANKVHYHLLVKNYISKVALEQVIEDAMPSREVIPWRKRVEAMSNEWAYCHYITKAKVGASQWPQGRRPLRQKARLLFKAEPGGLKRVRRHRRLLGAGQEQGEALAGDQGHRSPDRRGTGIPEGQRGCQNVYEFFGGCVPLDTNKRSFGLLGHCQINFSIWWCYIRGRILIVPFTMKSVSFDLALAQFCVAHLAPFFIAVLIQPRMHFQPGLRRRPGNRLDHHFRTHQRLARPVPVMWQNIRCSILFHLLVPGGKWQTGSPGPSRPPSPATAPSTTVPIAVAPPGVGRDQAADGPSG